MIRCARACRRRTRSNAAARSSQPTGSTLRRREGGACRTVATRAGKSSRGTTFRTSPCSRKPATGVATVGRSIARHSYALIGSRLSVNGETVCGTITTSACWRYAGTSRYGRGPAGQRWGVCPAAAGNGASSEIGPTKTSVSCGRASCELDDQLDVDASLRGASPRRRLWDRRAGRSGLRPRPPEVFEVDAVRDRA